MPNFAYRAKKGPQEIVTGTLEAGSVDEVVNQLAAQGLLAVSVEEASTGKASRAAAPLRKPAAAPGAPLKKALWARVRFAEITLFGRQLASLLRAGVPILKAIWIIREQSENPKFRAVLDVLHDRLREGKTLSSSMAEFPRYFPPVYLSLVRAGEDGGKLQEALMRVSEYRRKQEEIFSKLRTAMAYPLLMGFTGVGTIAFMLAFVIPKLTTMFNTLGGNLPMPTRILMAVSQAIRQPWAWGTLLVLGGAVFAFLKLQPAAARRLWSAASLRLPVIRGFVMKAELARFARTFELLIKSGIPVLRALSIAGPVLTNTVLRAFFARAEQDLAGGGQLGLSLRETGTFPLFMTNLISVAEESGQLDEAFAEIADYYERETDEAVKIMTSLIEPLMILVMGLIVGFIVIAMMLPMFEMNLMVR